MKIAIAGGGVAGLCLGALLAQHSHHKVTLIEKVAQYQQVGYVLALLAAVLPNGNSLLGAMLDYLNQPL